MVVENPRKTWYSGQCGRDKKREEIIEMSVDIF